MLLDVSTSANGNQLDGTKLGLILSMEVSQKQNIPTNQRSAIMYRGSISKKNETTYVPILCFVALELRGLHSS